MRDTFFGYKKINLVEIQYQSDLISLKSIQLPGAQNQTSMFTCIPVLQEEGLQLAGHSSQDVLVARDHLALRIRRGEVDVWEQPWRQVLEDLHVVVELCHDQWM